MGKPFFREGEEVTFCDDTLFDVDTDRVFEVYDTDYQTGSHHIKIRGDSFLGTDWIDAGHFEKTNSGD